MSTLTSDQGGLIPSLQSLEDMQGNIREYGQENC